MNMYNFDEIINRRGTHCVKWDIDTDPQVIPLWVADMDFKVAPCIQKALEKRIKHGIFGYTEVPSEYYKATIQWFKKKHNWTIDKEQIIYTSGVVPAMSAVIKAYCQKGDKILVQTPVYNCFFSSIRNNDCQTEDSPLVLKGNKYEIDFEDFERHAKDERVKIFLLCNPHNPAGRVWSKEELKRLGEICKRNNVLVVSDEIHCELVFDKKTYTPFASLGKSFAHNCVVLCSPTKSFNMAGLQIANIICPDATAYEKINKAININEICDVNPLGVEALIAAYTQGGTWIDELNKYIEGNYKLLSSFVAKQFPKLKLIEMEGTYLAWLDVSALGKSSDEICKALLEKAKVRLNPGTMYGADGFVRINLATSQGLLQEALIRIQKSGVLN